MLIVLITKKLTYIFSFYKIKKQNDKKIKKENKEKQEETASSYYKFIQE